MRTFPLFGHRVPVFAPEDGAGAAAMPDPAAAAPATEPAAVAPAPASPAPVAPGPAAPAKWFEDPAIGAEERSWLAARGLVDGDLATTLPKILKSARHAETLVSKPVIEKPAKDQPAAAWRRANAEALGLPGAEDGYAVAAPADWPKDVAWDAGLEAEARAFAFAQGVDPETHKGYVGIFAKKMQALQSDASANLDRANATMMADLQKTHGDKLPEVLAGAKQAAQFFAAQAGLDDAGISHISKVMAEGTGDAATIRFFAAIASAMGEDAIVGANKGALAFGVTPAQAAQELQTFTSAEGDYGKAFAAGDRRRLAELGPKREQLARLASMGQ